MLQKKEQWFYLVLIAVALVFFLAMPPLPQDPAYHNFAGQRRLLDIPNLWNVLSNLPFLLVGIWGLRSLRGMAERVLFLAVAATAFGSAWYHLSPRNDTLLWDRLPMAVAFMALFSLILGYRAALWPLVATGIASVLYWHLTGDLRLYAVVQFLPMAAIPVMMVLFPARFTPAANLVVALACYGAAKILELLDWQIFGWSGLVSGHTLKHLAAALATAYILAWLRARRTRNTYTEKDVPQQPPLFLADLPRRARHSARAAF